MKFPADRLTAWWTAAGAILVAAGMATAIVIERTGAIDDIRATKTVAADHETRLRGMETLAADLRADVHATKEDVSWIRLFLMRGPKAIEPDKVAQ